jgi:hypothetical protein
MIPITPIANHDQLRSLGADVIMLNFRIPKILKTT